MGQFAILILQRDAATGLLQHGFVLDEPIEADTPDEAVATALRSQNTIDRLGDSPACIGEVSAHRAFYERLAPSGEVVFSRRRQFYTNGTQEQEIAWFHIIRFARQRQNAICAAPSGGANAEVFPPDR